MKIKIEKRVIDAEFNPFTIMEVPISDELVQDCFLYNAIDAPSELKMMMLEQVAMAFDKFIINQMSEHESKVWMQNKLDSIEIKYK